MTHTADTITNALATRAAHWIGAYDQARERLTTKLAANQVVLHELDELVTAQARVRVAHELTASIEAIADFAMGDDDALEAELRRYLRCGRCGRTAPAAP